MTDWETCPAVERHPGKVSGKWVFRGTRVPVYALFENLQSGATVDEFAEWFPGVERADVGRRAQPRSRGPRACGGFVKILFDHGVAPPARWQKSRASTKRGHPRL